MQNKELLKDNISLDDLISEIKEAPPVNSENKTSLDAKNISDFDIAIKKIKKEIKKEVQKEVRSQNTKPIVQKKEKNAIPATSSSKCTGTNKSEPIFYIVISIFLLSLPSLLSLLGGEMINTGGNNDLIQQNIRPQIEPMISIIALISYMLSISFGFKAIIKFKEYGY